MHLIYFRPLLLPVDKSEHQKQAQKLIFEPSSVFCLPAPNLREIRPLEG